jgi:chromosome segregation ATPase
MRIILKDLMLSNFKGVRDFSLLANGQNVNIFGDNATGKTTLFDAFNWLLFDKDSSDSSKFQLKTVDKEGNVQHHLDHSVKASFLINNRPLDLQKVYREKWTKRRGSATNEFSGHTADYFIDGVPAQKKEFDSKVAELVRGKEELFKLLTSPTYFNEQYKWQQRRKVLLHVCGDLTDDEVIAGNKKLAELPGILGDHSIDDLRKIIANKRSEINKELDRIPIRIDEAEKSKPDIDGKSEEELKKSVEVFRQEIDQVDEEISRIRSGGEIDEKRNEKRKIEGHQLDLKNNFQRGIHEEIDEKRSEYFAEKSDFDRYTHLVADRKEDIEINERRIQKKEEQAADLRIKWAAENEKMFEFTGETVCPSCGQELPDDRVEDARAHASAEFNRLKAQHLEEIQKQGKELVVEIQKLNKENEMNGVDVAQFGETANLAKQKMDKIQEKIDELNAGTKNIIDDPEFKKTQDQIKSIEAEIKALQDGVDDALLEASGRKQDLKKQMNEAETSLLAFDSVRRIDKRIAELNAQEKTLNKEFEELEKQLFLTEEFIKTKVNMLEEKINSKFKMARFKLFEQQVNGGLNEVCETTYNGVPYNALNNAARINVGLDIINTLSEFFDLSAPIFIDNREAVTKLIDVDAQLISLIVSEKDKKLRIEAAEEMKVAI